MTLRRAVRAALRTTVLVGLACLALAAPPQLARGQDAPPPNPPATTPGADVTFDEAALRANGWLREEWYAVTARDVKVGWLRRRLTVAEERGAPHAVREFEVFLDVAGDGAGTRSRWRTSFPLAAPQRVGAASMETSEGGRRSSREAVRTADRFDITTQTRGRTQSGAVVAPSVTLADELAFERLAVLASAREGGPVGATVVAQGFTLGSFAVSPRRLLVKGVRGEGAARVLDIEVTVRTAPASGGAQIVESVQEVVQVDATGSVVSGALGPIFVYSRTDRETATREIDRKSIEALSRVPLDGKLGDVASIVRLTISCAADLAAVFPAHPRQLARQHPDRTTVIIVPTAPRAAVTEAEREAALAPEDGLDVDSREVREIAERLSSGANSRAMQADAICRWVAETLTDEIVLGTPATKEILASKRGDCTEHAQVFVALCRSIRLPARVVHGLMWMGDEAGAFGWHAWAEVALEDHWTAVDPTMGTMGADAAHIVVDDSPHGRARLWGAKFKLEKAERLPVAPSDPK